MNRKIQSKKKKRIYNFSKLYFIGLLFAGLLLFRGYTVNAQGTRLLRQPSVSDTHLVFIYGGDLWLTDLQGNNLKRITSTAAVETCPHISPDGQLIAFTSNRAGYSAVYTVPVEGGTPVQLTWHPVGAHVRGWTKDGTGVLFASARDFAPRSVNRLWTVSKEGGAPTLLSSQWANDGSFSSDGKSILIDRVTRWDKEWRNYKGGQNTPLILLNLEDFSEKMLPHEMSTDLHPYWDEEKIYFLSDRDHTMNIWSWDPSADKLDQVTDFEDSDIKWLDGNGDILCYERNGYINLFNPDSKKSTQLNIKVNGDFPWAEEQWEDLSHGIRFASLSPSGKRAVMESRGEIFTIPAEFGSPRNLTNSSGHADRRPVWSPRGDSLAWFSDSEGEGYRLMIAAQDGLKPARSLSLGISKLGWQPAWSPDGKYICFVDDDVRVRILDLQTGNLKTIDTGGINTERGSMELRWSPDSHWLAYSKTEANHLRRIYLWSVIENKSYPITNIFADAFSPAWDKDKKHLYFLASTELALGSGWVNTSAMNANPDYAVYLINLNKEDKSPFHLRSDEEKTASEDTGKSAEQKNGKKDKQKKTEKDKGKESENKGEQIQIDFEKIDRRTIPLPLKEGRYYTLLPGEEGTVFILQRNPDGSGLSLRKFSLKDRKAKDYIDNVMYPSVSADGKKILARVNGSWKVMDTGKPNGKDGKILKTKLQVKLNRSEEWEQIFEEAWRYERDYFYDPGLHGRDWQAVYDRYAPLIPYIKHRTDLNYVLDQLNGELSVGHSFVFGGDFPKTGSSKTGLLGADLTTDQGYWKIERIYTTESWNPKLSSPLDEPGLKVSEGNYLVGINGIPLKSTQNPWKYLDGTLEKQTILHINTSPSFEDAWQITIKPIGSENALRQRAWVEDNRRLVDSLSQGKLAYIWVPNTSGQGLVSFNRYFFAQQDKKAAIIDERFNGGGLLDDYMIDLMTRNLRAAYTNEVPNGKPGILPAGILGPKVLLINEMAGSGGDFFPWVFRQQKAGPLVGVTTWGGLVKSSVHYRLIDGGALTAPDNAIFDPVKGEWIAENKGIKPDIEVRQDAASLEAGEDPQLKRAVEEALKLLKEFEQEIKIPDFPEPAR